MDIQEVKNSVLNLIKNSFKLFKKKLKEALTLPYAKSYILLSIIMVFIFMIFTFPYNILIRNQIEKYKSGIVNNVTISNLDFNLIGISTFDNLTITTKSNNEISISEISLDGSMNPITLFISKKYIFDLMIDKAKYISKSIFFDFNLTSNIDLKINPENGKPEKGTLKFMFENSKLTMDNFELPAKLGGLPITLPPIKFKSIIANFNIKGNNINIETFHITGPDLNGKITGKFTLGKGNMILNSKLDLKITIHSDSPAIENFKDFLTAYTNSEGEISILLTGNLTRPQFSKDNDLGLD